MGCALYPSGKARQSLLKQATIGGKFDTSFQSTGIRANILDDIFSIQALLCPLWEWTLCLLKLFLHHNKLTEA